VNLNKSSANTGKTFDKKWIWGNKSVYFYMFSGTHIYDCISLKSLERYTHFKGRSVWSIPYNPELRVFMWKGRKSLLLP